MLRLNAVIMIFCLIAAGCGYPIKNTDSAGTTIICFGDSITYGVGAEGGKTYPDYLKELLGKDVINEGFSGDTTASALERLEKDVLTKDPYLVIVELGGNDFLQKIPREETLRDLEEIVVKIQEGGVMVALCDVSSTFFMWGYNKEFKRIARRTGAIFIPRLMKDILEDPTLKFDQVHPNSEGYKLIAERVYEAIKEYVK